MKIKSRSSNLKICLFFAFCGVASLSFLYYLVSNMAFNYIFNETFYDNLFVILPLTLFIISLFFAYKHLFQESKYQEIYRNKSIFFAIFGLFSLIYLVNLMKFEESHLSEVIMGDNIFLMHFNNYYIFILPLICFIVSCFFAYKNYASKSNLPDHYKQKSIFLAFAGVISFIILYTIINMNPFYHIFPLWYSINLIEFYMHITNYSFIIFPLVFLIASVIFARNHYGYYFTSNSLKSFFVDIFQYIIKKDKKVDNFRKKSLIFAVFVILFQIIYDVFVLINRDYYSILNFPTDNFWFYCYIYCVFLIPLILIFCFFVNVLKSKEKKGINSIIKSFIMILILFLLNFGIVSGFNNYLERTTVIHEYVLESLVSIDKPIIFTPHKINLNSTSEKRAQIVFMNPSTVNQYWSINVFGADGNKCIKSYVGQDVTFKMYECGNILTTYFNGTFSLPKGKITGYNLIFRQRNNTQIGPQEITVKICAEKDQNSTGCSALNSEFYQAILKINYLYVNASFDSK